MIQPNDYSCFEYREFEYRIYERQTPMDEQYDVYVKVGDEWIEVDDDVPSRDEAQTVAEGRVDDIIRQAKMEIVGGNCDIGVVEPSPITDGPMWGGGCETRTTSNTFGGTVESISTTSSDTIETVK